MNKISVIVPCYNEESSLLLFHQATSAILSELNSSYEILYINDGSKDQTLSLIKKLSASDPHVSFISFSRNFGKEAAMYAGLENKTGNLTVIMDADLQHPPVLLKQMYQKITTENYNCVGAKRTTRDAHSRIRNGLSKCFYKLIDQITPIPMGDGVGDFRMMDQSFTDALLSMKEVNRYTKGMMNFVGFNCAVIPYENIERVAGDSKWNLRSLFSYAVEGIVSFSTLPLILPFFIGIALSGIALLMLAMLCIGTLMHFHFSYFFFATSMGSLLFGLLFIGLGVLGEYMAKMYQEIKTRPVYIVQEAYFHQNKSHVSSKRQGLQLNLVRNEKKVN